MQDLKAPSSLAQNKRVKSVDLLRGLVMIIMALDHTRDFFHHSAFTENPLNPATTTPVLYFTRWITHFCAPAFVFLSGASAWFQSLKKTKKELSFFLVKRGIWLILLEITLINFVFSFDVHFSGFTLEVIWAIGISMVILGLMIWLPFKVILIAGLLIVFGHNSLDFYEAKNSGNLSLLYHIAHRLKVFDFGNFSLLVFYPFLPWTGLMLLGYCFGKLLSNTTGQQQKKILVLTGAGIVIVFIALRLLDIYGDPDVLTSATKPMDSVFSFLNTNKYPPSLLYMCMTIGPSILFIAFFQNTAGRIAETFSVYGRVPFFYFVLHFTMIHVISMIFFLSRGHSIKDGLNNDVMVPNFIKPGEGTGLWAVYLLWLTIVVALYPICKWYDRYKQSHKEKWWLSYL